MNTRKQNPIRKPRDPDFIGSDVTMRRAALRARRRAEVTAKMAAAKKGSVKVGGTPGGLIREQGKIQGTNTGRDPGEQSPRKKE